MGFYVGATKIYPGVIPTPDTTSNGATLFNDGTNGFWAYPGNTSSATTPASGWRYRTLLTHGYIAAGYKGYNPWRSVNKTWHQTDTTVFCGEQIDRAGAYLDGTFSDYNAYVHGTSDMWDTGATHTSSYNLFNGVMRMQNNSNFTFFGSGGAPYGYQGNNPAGEGLSYGSGQGSPNSTGGWDMSDSRHNHGCASSTPGNGATDGAGYVFGGTVNTTSKLHFPSEVMYNTTGMPTTLTDVAAIGGQSKAYVVGGSSNSYCWTMPWSNDTFSSWGFNGAYSDAYNKHLMSKYGWFYAGVYGNTNGTVFKFNDSNASFISSYSKLGSFGEENQQMGQDWGYMLGNYNGQQNNWTVKTTYSNDSQVTMGFATQPKGHYGTSSGCCSSAAASICSVQRT